MSDCIYQTFVKDIRHRKIARTRADPDFRVDRPVKIRAAGGQ
jgi:hypothetical protein